MKKFGLTTIAIVCCALITSNVAAQSDKVSIPIIPQPNQTTRLTLTKELDAETVVEATKKPIKLTMKSIQVFVQKSGAVDDQGRFEVEITCEDSRVEQTVNDTPLPSDEDMKKTIGKKFTLTYNREGRVLDVKVPSDLEYLTKSFSPMREFIYGNIPKGELSIGATTVSPMDFDKGDEIFNNNPLKYKGDMKYKLVAVVNDASYRIAKFDQTFEVKGTPTGTDSLSVAEGIVLDRKFSVNGTLEINLDKNLLKTYAMKVNFDSTTYRKVSATDPLMPIMTSKATLNASLSVKNLE